MTERNSIRHVLTTPIADSARKMNGFRGGRYADRLSSSVRRGYLTERFGVGWSSFLAIEARPTSGQR
jgi:hypothetical protein